MKFIFNPLTYLASSPYRRRPTLLLLILPLFLLAAVGSGSVEAAEFAEGEIYRLKAGETLNDDLYVFAREIIIDGTVDGDVIAFGGIIVLAMVIMAVFAPLFWTVDPTSLAPAQRTREPSRPRGDGGGSGPTAGSPGP